MLELHVWGLAFGLPSFDPQCLVAIAYLKQTVPPDNWTLVPSSNPLLSPGRSLPALRDGTIWTTSLNPIIAYLRQRVSPTSALGGAVPAPPLETAFSAYLSTHGQELYDLALFVSGANFTAVTRPLLSALFPFPVQYYLPLSLRSAAKARVSDLGVNTSELDEQETEPSVAKDAKTTAAEEQARQATTMPLRSWLRSNPEVVAGIKLRELVDTFFDTLEKQLGDDKYMLGGDEPSIADLWAVAYLSLFREADLPFAFVKDGLMRKPRLRAYQNDLFGLFFGPADMVNEGRAKGLPWGPVERGDLPWLTGIFFERVKDFLMLRELGSTLPPQLTVEEDDDPAVAERKREVAETRRREWWKNVFTVGMGVAGFFGYIFWSGLPRVQLVFSNGEEADEDEEDEDEEDEEEEDEEE